MIGNAVRETWGEEGKDKEKKRVTQPHPCRQGQQEENNNNYDHVPLPSRDSCFLILSGCFSEHTYHRLDVFQSGEYPQVEAISLASLRAPVHVIAKRKHQLQNATDALATRQENKILCVSSKCENNETITDPLHLGLLRLNYANNSSNPFTSRTSKITSSRDSSWHRQGESSKPLLEAIAVWGWFNRVTT